MLRYDKNNVIQNSLLKERKFNTLCNLKVEKNTDTSGESIWNSISHLIIKWKMSFCLKCSSLGIPRYYEKLKQKIFKGLW